MIPKPIQKSETTTPQYVTARRNNLGHLVGSAQREAEQYIAERQALIAPVRNYLYPPQAAKFNAFKSKLRVKQLAYVDVKNMPIDVVCDLWGVRFGNEWVDHEVIQPDELMAAIAQRLVNENLVERQVVTNKMKTMYRLSLTGWRE